MTYTCMTGQHLHLVIREIFYNKQGDVSNYIQHNKRQNSHNKRKFQILQNMKRFIFRELSAEPGRVCNFEYICTKPHMLYR